MTLEQIKHSSYEQAQFLWRQGFVTDEVWETYCHLWQTSAPRFSLQVCHCNYCLERRVDL